MKKIAPFLFVALCALLYQVGCASRPPTVLERRYFDIQTNVVPVVQVQTNIVPITLLQTNTITVTNVQGVLEVRTNIVLIPAYQTNTITVTNRQESYVYTPGAGASEIQQVGGAIGSLFGVGGIVSTAIGAFFSLWGYGRSKKNYVTAANVAQTVEVLREFIKSLPDGSAYDTALVQWMQAHQAEAGVMNQVIDILQRDVNNPDAIVAAQQVRNTINALRNLPKS